MPDVNLSTLSGPELRRLLDATRERGEAALSYQILQEMAARREGPARKGLFQTRRPAAPRIVAVDLGDPMEPKDDDLPDWTPPPEPEVSLAAEPEPAPRRSRRKKAPPEAVVAPPVAEVEPPLLPEPRPRSVWDSEPEPLAIERPRPKRPGLRLRLPGRGLGMGFAAGIAAGLALGWWVGGVTREAPPAPATPAPAPVQIAALEPRAAPVAAPVAPAAEPEPAPEAPAEASEAPVLSPDAEDVSHDAVAQAVEPPPPVETVAPEPAVAADPCAAEPTPADRTICGDRELRRLQRRLQRAYAEALDAHEEKGLLRQRQLAWREARNDVADPGRLARLYERRIEKLNSATAEARRER